MVEIKPDQKDIDAANADFSNTLCGSLMARNLGIDDNNADSRQKFDDWYFDYYPYLLDHVPAKTFFGKRVLEVGLGYGSLSQKIAESGADYLGMDIALGPVSMVKQRLRELGLPGDAVQRSFLDNQLPSESFDAVVAIGCFHHTGDVQRCFDETWRILRPGGTAHLMVYNRYSHRRWTQEREKFLDELVAEEFGQLELRRAEEHERASNDTDLAGRAAPETVFLSVREMTARLGKFSKVRITKENMDESMDPDMERKSVLNSWGHSAGLDLYAWAVK